MTKPVILTGLRANNDLHIGNYFGGLLPLIDMATQHSDTYEINLFVPDLHSFTTPIDHSKLQSQILHNLKLFVAAGLPLDNDSVHIYRQSYVPAHSELTWILDCFTGFGQMKRMTQFKDKVTNQSANRETITHNTKAYYETLMMLRDKEDDEAIRSNLTGLMNDFEAYFEQKFLDDTSATIGLFNYPVLMAADILLYNATYVPVGDDQSQHLEFTRDIAERMNSKFGELFTVPEPVKKQHEFFGKEQGLRIKDLADPSRKMSKSTDTDKGVIFLGDEPAAAAKKIMSATTDSEGTIRYDTAKQPGIANLLEILTLLRNQVNLSPVTVEQTAGEWEGKTQYGEFKQKTAEAVHDFLINFQSELANVDEAKLLAKLETDEKLMNQKANETLLRTQKAVGLR